MPRWHQLALAKARAAPLALVNDARDAKIRNFDSDSYMNGGGAGPLEGDGNRDAEPPARRGPSTMSPTARGSRMGEERRCKDGGATQVPRGSGANSHGFDISQCRRFPAALFRVQPGPSDEVTNRNMIASPHGANAWRRCSERESIQRSNGALTALLNSRDASHVALCWIWPICL